MIKPEPKLLVFAGNRHEYDKWVESNRQFPPEQSVFIKDPEMAKGYAWNFKVIMTGSWYDQDRDYQITCMSLLEIARKRHRKDNTMAASGM